MKKIITFLVGFKAKYFVLVIAVGTLLCVFYRMYKKKIAKKWENFNLDLDFSGIHGNSESEAQYE